MTQISVLDVDLGVRAIFRSCHTIGKINRALGCYTLLSKEKPKAMETLLDSAEIQRALRRIASSIVEATGGVSDVALVGVRRGGVVLSRRLAAEIEAQEGQSIAVGAVDIALYRDDAATALPDPKIGPNDVPFPISGRDVIIVDDVLQTGRTIRAAIDCLLDYGRPRRIWLAVLLDREGRELPIAADFVGRRVQVSRDSKVRLNLGEVSGKADQAFAEKRR